MRYAKLNTYSIALLVYLISSLDLLVTLQPSLDPSSPD